MLLFDRQWCFGKLLLQYIYMQGSEKTLTELFSVKFLNAKPPDSAVKVIGILAFSKWLLRDPKTPHLPLLRHRRSVLNKRGARRRRSCSGKTDSNPSCWNCSTTRQINPPVDTALQQSSNIKDNKEKEVQTHCMGWQDWAFCSPGPRWEERSTWC